MTKKTILRQNMDTTNLLSKLIKSDKLETVKRLNQALDCIGVDQPSKLLNQNQLNEIEHLIVQKFIDLVGFKSLAVSIIDLISAEELESFRHELSLKIDRTCNRTKAPIYQKRLDTLKSCFEEVSGDNVI
ncbi:hypothetical protein [Marinifilum sp.]|uniref:hypothetical protein n=1 Tax=Marinifilum sp. TaxID=2033137 RepID=UPI003BA8F1A0